MRRKGLPKFSFYFVTLEETLKEVALLPLKKSRSNGILYYITFTMLFHYLNEICGSLKHANITPIFKKDDNYRPIGILSNLIKIYKRFRQNQMCPYLNQIFSKYQCGFKIMLSIA